MTATERPPIEVMAERVEIVRRLYGLGQPLPPEVSLWREVPRGLPIRPAHHIGNTRGDDTLPHKVCGEVAWRRTADGRFRWCYECQRRRKGSAYRGRGRRPQQKRTVA